MAVLTIQWQAAKKWFEKPIRPLGEESEDLVGPSECVGKPISLSAESTMSPEQYDTVLL